MNGDRADVAIVRPWPFGGGDNLALAQSIARYSSLPRVDLYVHPASRVPQPVAVSPRLRSRPLRTISLRARVLLLGHVRRAADLVQGARVVDVAEDSNGYSAGVARAAKRLRRPAITTCLETVDGTPISRFPPWRGHRRTVRECTRMYRVLTGRAGARLRRLGVDDAAIRLLPLGIDTELFHPAASPLDRGTTRYLFARRLEEKNGLWFAVEAIRALVADGASVRLTVAGDGPLAGRLREEARRLPIDVVGRVPYARLAELYRESDVYLNPGLDTRWRGRLLQEDGQYTFPLLEAQASGLPVITTRSGANDELVGPGNPVVEQGDSVALRSALTICRDPGVRRRLGATNRSFILERFDARRWQGEYDRWVDEVATERV
ncbi:MAG: glycosyltransferase family 4 protein [Thermoplasmata archaeon]|nr:glycosyltransferase family 4 protein [Thermoplasmata archaeon]